MLRSPNTSQLRRYKYLLNYLNHNGFRFKIRKGRNEKFDFCSIEVFNPRKRTSKRNEYDRKSLKDYLTYFGYSYYSALTYKKYNDGGKYTDECGYSFDVMHDGYKIRLWEYRDY